MYINYWRKSFDYKSKAKLVELFTALAGNISIILLLLLVGLAVPVTHEQLVVDIMYVIGVLMILPMISLIYRLIQHTSKKTTKN